MKVAHINPYVRFASVLRYTAKGKAVRVVDCRLFYITEGSAVIRIEDQSYPLEPGCLFYCCAGSVYKIEAEMPLSLLCLDFDLTLENSHFSAAFSPCEEENRWDSMEVLYEPVSDSPFLGSHFYLADASGLQHPLEQLIEHYADSAPFSRELCAAELKRVLIELHRLPAAPIPPKIAYVMDYIRKHYREDITNAQLAGLVGYHAYYLNRIFTAATGTTLHSYLLRQRLNSACYLLLNTELDLKEIPERTGFRSYPHFSSYFKRVYGVAPQEYRKQFRGAV